MSVWYDLVEWLPLSFVQYDFMKNALLAILLIAPLFGLAGTMVINNRMSYYSDALGHSALAGIAIGTLFGLQDFLLSMILFAVLFGLGIAVVKNRARSSTDTIIGVFSASAVALGIALLSRHGGFASYNNFLVGDILAIRAEDIRILLLVLGVLLLFWILFFNQLLMLSVNSSLARSKGIRIRLLENAFMILVAILVTVSIKWVGTLLINSLLILPASAARNLARSMRQYHVLSLAFCPGCRPGRLAAVLLSGHGGRRDDRAVQCGDFRGYIPGQPFPESGCLNKKAASRNEGSLSMTSTAGSGHFDFLVPAHHGAQFVADLFDLVLGFDAAAGHEIGPADLVFHDPVAGKDAFLDFLQDLFHFLFGLVGDDAAADAVIAIFGGVADRVAHQGQDRPGRSCRRSASFRGRTRNRRFPDHSQLRPALRNRPSSAR